MSARHTYSQYKDSGIEWLGSVPEHWVISRSDAVTSSSAIQLSEDFFVGKEVFHYSIPVIQESGDGQYEDGEDISSSKLKITKPQLLVSKLNPRKSTICIARPNRGLTVCSGEFVPLYAEHCDLQYLYFLVSSEWFRQRLDSLVESATRSHQRAKPEYIKKFWWPWPSLGEQRTIASFLDRETTRIAALIEKKERLIELLQEKRQSIISQAVAKGLDPSVPMKDSGMEWLGEIPEHWEITPFKRTIIGIESGTSVNAIDIPANSNEVGVLKTSCVYSGFFDPSENKTVVVDELDRVNCSVRGNTLVVSRMNTPSLVGAAGFVEKDFFNIFLPDRLWMISFDQKLADTKFIHFWTKTKGYRSQVEMACSGTSSSMQNLSQDKLKNFSVALPPVEEQISIVKLIKEQDQGLEKVIERIEQSIVLLQERRSALITAAVTGQIDVREAS